MSHPAEPAMRRFAVLTAGVTLALILAGGFVTTTRTGDTIPTWPKSWGRMEVGWPVEWTHRAFAGTVAILVTVLAFWIQRREPRPWVRKLAWGAFAAVLVQALLGGLRVHQYFPKATAIVHATLAQVVFSTLVCLALVLSEAWTRIRSDDSAAEAAGIGRATTLFAFLQLIAGAVTRHTGWGLAVHLVGAALVLVHVSIFASRLFLTPLRKGASALLWILGVQVSLGLGTWAITASGFERSHHAPVLEIVTVSAHVAIGAALLATSLAVTLVCHRSRAVAPELALA
ncbi:MAG TPA: COX15/CtaA family protein [Planctomycetota bacterium]|nr:COX15/CtaA family protein [Planctomycetota bacterium]